MEALQLPILLLTSVAPSTFLEGEQEDLMRPGVYYLNKEDAADRLIPTVNRLLALRSSGATTT